MMITQGRSSAEGGVGAVCPVCPAPHPPSGCSLPRGSQESHSRQSTGLSPQPERPGCSRSPEALLGGGPLIEDPQGHGTLQSPTQGPVPPLPPVLPYPGPPFPQRTKDCV